MDQKYPEIVQFFRDMDNQTKLQQAANEYQTFSKTFHKMINALNFEHTSLDNDVFQKLKEKQLATLKNPMLQ
jgi:predicted glycosyltransferase